MSVCPSTYPVSEIIQLSMKFGIEV